MSGAEIAEKTGLSGKRVGVLLPGLERAGRVAVDRSGRPYRYGYPASSAVVDRLREADAADPAEARGLEGPPPAPDPAQQAGTPSSPPPTVFAMWGRDGEALLRDGETTAIRCRLREQVRETRDLLDAYVFAHSDPVLGALYRALRASEEALEAVQATTQEG